MAISLLRIPTVQAITGRSRSSIYAAIQAGLFTSPVLIGARSVAWPENEVSVINAARISGKTDEEIREIVSQLEAARHVAVIEISGEGR